MWVHAIQPTYPVAFTGGGKLPEEPRGFPSIIALVQLGVNLFEREDHEREWAELIGEGFVEQIGEVFTIPPMLLSSNPVLPDGLANVPSSRGEVVEAIDPASRFPMLVGLGEVD